MECPRTSTDLEDTRAPVSFFRTSSPRCIQCNARQKENPRNLVVCLDGTSNDFGLKNTNVVKLFHTIDAESANPEQFTFYSSGIGARPQSRRIFGRMWRAVYDRLEMAVAWNVEEIVKDAYRWLAQMYQEGDQIYLFGFSRGAYQVRVLAGMIHEVGLLTTPTEKQIETAYCHYEAIRPEKPSTGLIAREFKNTFCWKDSRVHFIGVWDTVSSVGLIRGDVILSASSSAAHACHFRHALALDELRVKFMPEYFYEMNSQMDDKISKYIVASRNAEQASSAEEQRGSGLRCNGSYLSEIKEVWFPGSHTDVGGKSKPGKFRHAGNVSLLWMRREAAANGLVLKPTDIVWLPDDLDSGVRNSMTHVWRVVEYLPIKHQVSFGGAGEHAFRMHRLQPRRIIPGQKVHASILYANVYQPKATLGEGFDIPIIQSGLEDMELDDQIWETGLFDGTAAQELVTYLGSEHGVMPKYLDSLLFMLRFKEGKQYVRNIPNWQDNFMRLIKGRNFAPLVRLVAIVAYHEVSCDPEVHPNSCAPPPTELSRDVFKNAKKFLMATLDPRNHRDDHRVVALLRPLTKHQILRERILTQDVLKTLIELFDRMIGQSGGKFAQAMDGLNCMLQCAIREIPVEKLGDKPPKSNVSRLYSILKVHDPRLLIAALHVVLTLARIPEEKAGAVCSEVKPRIKELVRKDGLVGLLAVKILLALDDPSDWDKMNIHDPRVQANLAGAMVYLNIDRCGSAGAQDRDRGPGQQILRHLFGIGTTGLTAQHKKLIGELKRTVQKGNDQERIAATMILLKLYENTIIRTYLRDLNLLGIFVSQLQRKDSALLAAHALVTCSRHSDLKESLKDNEDLPKHVVNMLRFDHFDGAIGQVEGFQIFGSLMQHIDLRKNIKNDDIMGILKRKLASGKQKETRTSLISLAIFMFFYPDVPWTHELVTKGLELLRDTKGKAQRAGTTILSALAQTERGVVTISPRIHEIVEMLLPDDCLSLLPTATQTAPESPTYSGESEGQPATTPTESTQPRSSTSLDALTKSASWMMEPAHALCILGQNETLRNCMRRTPQYRYLKDLYQSDTLSGKRDTWTWRVRASIQADVSKMLGDMIRIVDQ